MKFGLIPVPVATGTILAHAVRADGLLFRKGRILSADDIAALTKAGIAAVMAAQLEANDVAEDAAALRIAEKLIGHGLRADPASAGRVNLYAEVSGLILLEAAKLETLNSIDEAITVATIGPHARVVPGQMVATIKIIPFAVPGTIVAQAEHAAGMATLGIAPFSAHRIGLISTMLPDTKKDLTQKNRAVLGKRLSELGSEIVFARDVAHDTDAIAAAIIAAMAEGCDPILIMGASAITDRGDVVPGALEQAGGTILRFGMPVDPGNLLLLGEIQDRRVVGLPGCARSPKLNGFDFVLWRMLARLPVSRSDIAAMGVGGLLGEIPTRPRPRESLSASDCPNIAAVILAAGLSSRMGSNKLLKVVRGKPLVRHVAEAALASGANPVIVVTGNESEKIAAALSPLPLLLVKNDVFSDGLSTSLKRGVRSVPPESAGALVLLGDMPDVGPELIDSLIAAFAPSAGHGICVPVRDGQRGNPVLWGRAFFDEITTLEGDVGAKALMAAHAEAVCEVEAPDNAPLTDIDTPEALAEYMGQ